jgi:predicted DNA-binding protein (UPF0251 family)
LATCIDCGKPIGDGSLRCIEDRGRHLKAESLVATAASDREILAMVDTEGLNGTRVAARLGISRVRARERIMLARSREAERTAAEAAQ